MPDRDVVLAKVAAIQRCLKRIKETTRLDPNSIDDIDKQDIFILNLQRAVQAAIDLATHIVASEGLGLSDTIKDNFKFLKNAGIMNTPRRLCGGEYSFVEKIDFRGDIYK